MKPYPKRNVGAVAGTEGNLKPASFNRDLLARENKETGQIFLRVVQQVKADRPSS